jgi:L,D-peptidoglycan transpeptidase YkuD (ErfK/YbiS/YcfS/YnhG family)
MSPPSTPPSTRPPAGTAIRAHVATTPPAALPSTPRSTSSAAPGTLPLRYSTGDATQVITVVAASHSSTRAVLQSWERSGGHWSAVGPAVAADLGTDGIGHASERTTTTPEGSFTLTQAFGRYPDPGTRLPYRRITPADWWISQPGPLYNTEQHCSSNCPFTTGEPNEHLYYAMPYYRYAVVIDYNRDPVVPGAGSAFFLHVTAGQPTQGCVSIAQDDLVRIMRWLDPARHPRILMGVG